MWDGFPWVLLGYSQVTVLPVAQAASIVGVYGLSALARDGIDRGRADRRSTEAATRWVFAAATAVLLAGRRGVGTCAG